MPEARDEGSHHDDAVRAGVAARYSREAEAYRRHWGPLLLRPGLALLEGLAIAEARRVADIGCGVGLLLPHLRRRAPRALVIGVDAAEGMLRLAPQAFPRSVMDAAVLALQDASLDAAVLAFMLFHVPDPARALAEVHRVLRPGGVVALGTWAADPEDFTANRIWFELLDEHAVAADDAPPPRHDLMDSPKRVAKLLAGASLKVTGSRTMVNPDAMDAEEFLARRTRLGASRRRFESLPPDARGACLDAARARLAGLAPEDLTSRERAILTWARRPGKA